ncbi:MAG: hypothetical protein AAGD01_06645 [Acidobacteriota bacterium]
MTSTGAANPSAEDRRPHVVLVIPRGEAVRNFLYSDTLSVLAEQARVTVLSVVTDERVVRRAQQVVEEVIALQEYPQAPWPARLRVLTENAHDRWLWSAVARNNWALRDLRAQQRGRRLRRWLTKGAASALAHRPVLEGLTNLERSLTYRQRPTEEFHQLFQRLQPDLVFNGSHIHGFAGELPLRVAQRLGIPTAGFIFSWDNLTSRSRIFVPYDHYLVWHQNMKDQLLSIYRDAADERVHVTGTPQLDFHFRDDLSWDRETTCRHYGLDPQRPYVVYTAGIAHHFPEEHRHVEKVIESLAAMGSAGSGGGQRPQLVVRVNVKDTSPEMKALAQRGDEDVVFPPVAWDPVLSTPHYEDLSAFSNLLRHCAVGVNAASTVSLELLLFGKPVINLDFDPPGTDLPWDLGYPRHIRFDHFKPVAESGATMVARASEDIPRFLQRGLEQPEADAEARQAFLRSFFGDLLEGVRAGDSGRRVAESLLQIASPKRSQVPSGDPSSAPSRGSTSRASAS